MKQSVCLFLMRDIAAIYFLLVCRSVAWRLSNSIYRLLPQDLRSQSFKPTSPLDLDTTTHIFRSPSTSQITHFHQLASLLAHHLVGSSAPRTISRSDKPIKPSTYQPTCSQTNRLNSLAAQDVTISYFRIPENLHPSSQDVSI